MQHVENVPLRQVRDFGQLISDTFRFLKLHWRPLFRAIGVLCVPPMLIGGLLVSRGMVSIQRSAWSPGGIDEWDAVSPFAGMGWMALGYLAMVAGFLLVNYVVYEYLRACHLGEHVGITTGELWIRVRGQVGSYLGISILTGLLVVLGFVLCVLPGIYAWVVLSLAFMVHAIERSGTTAAMSRSAHLIKERWWETFGLVFVVGLIQSAVTYILMIPFIIVMMVLMFSTAIEAASGDGFGGMPGWYDTFSTFSTVLQFALSIFTAPLMIVTLGLKYFSLVEEKEGAGLRERIDGFDQA